MIKNSYWLYEVVSGVPELADQLVNGDLTVVLKLLAEAVDGDEST